MAEVKEVTVSRTCKINIGNYESVDHFVSMKAELDPFDDPEEAVRETAAQVETAMAAQLARSYRVRGKKMGLADVVKHHGLALVRTEE